MTQIEKFDYDTYWVTQESAFGSGRFLPTQDGDWDDLIDEIPPPAFLRRESRVNPFPLCRRLLAWPRNYPAAEEADLEPDEWAETEPTRFVYSEQELDAWRAIVQRLLEEVLEPPRHLLSATSLGG